MAARNVLNVDAVDAFLAALGELAAHEAVRDWLKGTARRHILRVHERVYHVVRERPTGRIVLEDPDTPDWDEPRLLEMPVPDWCTAALERGDQVVFLRLDGPLAKTVRRVIEYLDAYLEDLPKRRPNRRIDRIGYTQAIREAQKMRRQINAARPRAPEPGAIPVYRLGHSVAVIQLTTPQNLAREGAAMDHCVADYADALRLEECEIYSVRDGAGTSHATIEVDRDGRVVQVKGKGNGPVPGAFRPAVRAFIVARGYELLDDFWNLSDIVDWVMNSGEQAEKTLLSHEGRVLLRAYRFAGGSAQPDIELSALTQLIFSASYNWSHEQLAAVFAALSPGAGAPVHLRSSGGYWAYDRFVATVEVELPLMLLNLINHGTFNGTTMAEEGRRILRAVENILPTLVFRELDRVYLLGRTRTDPADWRSYNWNSTADFLLDCPYDIRSQRANRHRALLETLNRSKRRAAGRRAPASDAHLALRRLVTGAAGIYAI